MEVYDELEKALKEIERLKEDNKYLNKVNIELSTEKNRLNNIINKAIRFIEEGDLLYLASKCSIIYRNNIEVVAICDRLKDLLDILKGEDKE